MMDFEWFDILFGAVLILLAIYWIAFSSYKLGFRDAVQAKRTRLTEEELDRVTMALLGKTHNPSPDLDWYASRSHLFSEWRVKVHDALAILSD